MNENQKLEKIKESKNNIESLVNQAQETRDFLHKEKNSSAIKVGKFEATKA